MNYITLNTGARMPIIGLGTWNVSKNKAEETIKLALLEYGYRHVDCAAVYQNEKEIGNAFFDIFSKNLLKREDVFITSKLWNTEHKKENVIKACEKTLKDLKLDYLDLYLMHFGISAKHGDDEDPVDENGYLITENVSLQETWKAMESLTEKRLVKAIGISNFTVPMLLDLLSYAKIIPAVNQIELHPYLQQESLIEFLRYKNIAAVAYTPLGNPKGGFKENFPVLLKDKMIQEIAAKHDKSAAQILLKWGIQRNTSVIPKSENPDHLKSNIEIFDFELPKEDMELIKTLDKKYRFVNPEDWWKLPYFD